MGLWGIPAQTFPEIHEDSTPSRVTLCSRLLKKLDKIKEHVTINSMTFLLKKEPLVPYFIKGFIDVKEKSSYFKWMVLVKS